MGRVEKGKKERAGEGSLFFFFFFENTYFSLRQLPRPNPSVLGARFTKTLSAEA